MLSYCESQVSEGSGLVLDERISIGIKNEFLYLLLHLDRLSVPSSQLSNRLLEDTSTRVNRPECEAHVAKDTLSFTANIFIYHVLLYWNGLHTILRIRKPLGNEDFSHVTPIDKSGHLQ